VTKFSQFKLRLQTEVVYYIFHPYKVKLIKMSSGAFKMSIAEVSDSAVGFHFQGAGSVPTKSDLSIGKVTGHGTGFILSASPPPVSPPQPTFVGGSVMQQQSVLLPPQAIPIGHVIPVQLIPTAVVQQKAPPAYTD
jgi:hypothetical protein